MSEPGGLVSPNGPLHELLFLPHKWWLRFKSKRLQRELGRSYITMYVLGSEVNVALFSLRYKRREHRPHFVVEGISKSHGENSLWDRRYCDGHTNSHTWLAHTRGIRDQVALPSIMWTNKVWIIIAVSPSKWVSTLL